MRTKFLLLLGAILLWGCSDTLEENLNSDFQKLEIQINGNIDQEYVSRVNDGGFCDGDQIGLYGVNWTDKNTIQGTLQDENNQVNNVRYTYDGEKGVWTSSVSAYYKDVNTNIDLYAYYPYGVPTNVNEYPFEVAKDQNNDDGYGMSDFLWAKTENVQPSEGKVKLLFDHILSCVKVVLTEGENFEKGEFEKLSKSVMVKNTKHSSTIDLSTGIATVTGNPSNEGILMMEDESDSFRAIVVPQTVGAQNVLFAITVDGITYNYKQAAAFVYEAGKQAMVTLSVTKNTATGTYEFELTDTQIVDWTADNKSHNGTARQYYVVHQETPGTLGELIVADGKNPNKIKNLKITGNVDASDFYFMRDNMEILEAVNMKECKIHDSGLFGEDVIPDYALSFGYDGTKHLTHFVFPEKVVKIGERAFRNTLLSGALIIPNDVVEIGHSAFALTNITSLSLPGNIKKLGQGAFAQCSSLTGNLSLPSSLESIGQECFDNCSFTGNLIIPSGIKDISDATFRYCDFSELVIPDGVKTIGYAAFYDCGKLSGQLVLPESLVVIGTSAFYGCSFQGELIIPSGVKVIETSAFSFCNFSNLVLQEGLVEIGDNAFAYNKRLSGMLRFPESLTTIKVGAFSDCLTLSSLELPSKLATIQVAAFGGCYGIASIISHAVQPPTIIGSAFDGVAKDNFTLEVPEASVADYQTAPGWNEFRRISAHHDFSIGRPLMRTLNAEYSKEYTLRVPSGMNWSIKSKPDWVTITPSSGVGKQNVTITVNKMERTSDTFTIESKDEYGNISSQTYQGRADEIVFLLDDKNYTSIMKVEQYDYDYGDGDVIEAGTIKNNGVNLVFMGDCFDAQDIATGKYMDGINQAIEHFFAIEPYKSYRNYFNVYTVVGMSPDSGMGTVNTIREAKFGSQYTIHAGVAPDEGITFEYACKAQTVNESNIHQSLVVLVENSQDYGGITYMWPDGSAIAVCPMSDDAYPYDFRGLVQHEAGGHGFGKLGDEYIYHNAFIEACSCLCCPHIIEFNTGKSYGWYDNLSLTGDMNEVPWSHLIFHPDYSDKVDMYEGGFYHARGVYRSERTSCMNNNIPYFSAISRQTIVERIMKYAGESFSQESFYAMDKQDAGGRSIQQSWDKVVTPSYVGASKQHAPKIMSGKPRIGK